MARGHFYSGKKLRIIQNNQHPPRFDSLGNRNVRLIPDDARSSIAEGHVLKLNMSAVHQSTPSPAPLKANLLSHLSELLKITE
jgi:hypothetical protein